ncbi:restriction endonuclease subunit S [Saccharococcus caldoxylosilyticus]|uniref:restriction endonuclease subunit S n=1 Tax=Saccharococcus caldoxylosilyticus TaxID=81408 RepID=UPI0002E7BE48|nr:restriction endonuclease subunit S [Parageobacillus caldoxylosilyticus]
MSKTKQKSIEELLEGVLVPEEEKPYSVPENWVWVWFKKVVRSISNGKKQIPQKYYKENGLLPVVDQGQQLISGYTDNLELRFSEELPVIIFGDHTKCIKWIDFDFVQGADGIKILKPLELIHPKYLYYLLQNVNLPDKGYSRHFKYLKETPLPIAPLSEQKRIAEKVERLFAKIDEAKRLIEEVKESFELRRAAILDKAFKGQLDTNDPNEKSMLETSSDIKEKDLIPKEEQPYEVPENWVWVKLESISEYIQRGKSPKYVEKSSVKVVSQKCVQWTGFDISKARFIDENTLPSYKEERFLRKGDLLWNSTGTGTIGRIAKIDNELEGLVVADSHVTVIRPNSSITDSSFLYRWFSSPFVQDKINGLSSGSTNQIELSLSAVKGHPVPFPPLNEQKRIAEKVDNLLNKLENEKELVLEVEEKLDLLKQSILNKAFRGELGTNDPTDEHAIELLKEVLKSK